MSEKEVAIQQTKKWITDVVIGCNFCPFASREMKRNAVHFQVENCFEMKESLHSFLKECIRLDENQAIETTLLIFPSAWKNFRPYLVLVSKAEMLLKKNGYEGIYQVAGFHPLYQFADSIAGDAADFTNRSPYPMLHLLREDRITEALEHFPHPEKIPSDNTSFAREKGYAFMKMLRQSCLKID